METTTQLLTGNSIELAKTLPSNSVHCIVTSPPYKGLRRYLPSDHTNAASEIGIEAVHDCGAWGRMVLRPGLTTDELQSIYRLSTTSGIIPDEMKQYYIKAELCGECYVCRMVALFRELKRVLRDDGVCFLNLGDSYNGSGGAGGDYAPGGIRAGQPKYPGQKMPGLKPKDMMLVPQRVALALQADGWWIRQDIIWVKKSAMPEPAKDRFVRAHEVVWLLAKSARYYWDRFAVSEPSDYGAHHAKYQGTYQRHKIEALQQAGAPNGDNYQEGLRRPAVNPYLRNKRDVWVLDQDAFSGAHFATMPRELARICVLAGTSAAGCCAKCGAPLVRDVISGGQLPLEDDPEDQGRTKANGAVATDTTRRKQLSGAKQAAWRKAHPHKQNGWLPTCTCNAEIVPCVVLDPFSGSGTTVAVAKECGRSGIGFDLNEEYQVIAQARIAGVTPPLFAAGYDSAFTDEEMDVYAQESLFTGDDY